MPRLLVLLAFVLGPAVLAAPASAQTALPTGDWTGSIRWGGAEPVALAGDLEECAEGLKLRLQSDGGVYEADAILPVAAGSSPPALRFAMTNTQRQYALSCTANPQEDGSFAGRCQTADGTWAQLTLQPPSRSTLGCSE